jgi:hypothetical protein
LNVSPAAVRARALRGGWRRQPGNDGKARVLITADIVRAAAEQPREQPRKTPIAELANVLRAHVETLKGDVARLEAVLAHEQARSNRSAAELTALAQRLAELAARPWWRRLPADATAPSSQA